MRVFISWSGETSKRIGESIRNWIPNVIQAVQPYFTPDDIAKGSRWSMEIAKELESCKVGILCITKENFESPWVMFEAGALSKNLEMSKVCPLLFWIDPSDIKGPLVQFQAAKFSKEELKKVMMMINSELQDEGLNTSVLDQVFEKWWPDLDIEINEILKDSSNNKKDIKRSDRELLEEILDLTRSASMGKFQSLLTYENSVARMLLSNKFGSQFDDNLFRLSAALRNLIISTSDERRSDSESVVQRMYNVLEYVEQLGQYSNDDQMRESFRLSILQIREMVSESRLKWYINIRRPPRKKDEEPPAK